MSASVNYIKTPFTPKQEDYSCPICFEPKSARWFDSYIVHPKGEEHPVHYKCVKEWLIKSKTCPSCRIPIAESLHSGIDRIGQCFKDGVLELEKLFVFGAASVAIIAVLELFGLPAGKSVLGTCGFSFIAAKLFAVGFGTYASEKDSNEQTRVGVFCGLLAGTIFGIFTGAFQESSFFQAYAILNLARAAGLIRPSIGASLGAVTTAALLSSGGWATETVAAGIGGAIGALVNVYKNPAITLLSAKAGATVAMLACQYVGKATIAGALGAAWAAGSSTLMNQWRILYAYSFA